MSLEDVRAVEALLGRATRAWAEAAHHRAFVVRQCVSVLVVLACETFSVVLACGDRALLRALILVCEHVCLEVLEVPPACGIWAKPFAGFIGRRSMTVS
jgi:hypothetical protein